MRTMEISVYMFDELSEKAKERVLEKHRDINVDHEWHESTIAAWKEKLAEKGFEDAKIYFSGFSSQGDGACFDAECNISKLAVAVYSSKLVDEGFYREVLQLLVNGDSLIIAKIEKNSYGNHYSHANTRYISIDDSVLYYHTLKEREMIEETMKILQADLVHIPAMISEYEGDDEILSGLITLRLKYSAPAIEYGDLIEKFRKDINELRENLSNEIYRELEKDYYCLVSDEQVIETIKANSYEFDEDGDMI